MYTLRLNINGPSIVDSAISTSEKTP